SFCLSFTPRFEMIAMVEWPTQSFPRKIGLIIDLVFGQSFIHSRCRGALSWPTTPLQESFRQRIHTLSELRELYHLSQEASSMPRIRPSEQDECSNCRLRLQPKPISTLNPGISSMRRPRCKPQLHQRQDASPTRL